MTTDDDRFDYVYKSKELLEILDEMLGTRSVSKIQSPETTEDTILRYRVDRKVRQILAAKGKYSGKVNTGT